MNFKFYMEKLKSSKEYKKFMKENPGAYLCSGFFVIDKIGNDNKMHFDFYVRNIKKIFSFQLEEGIRLVPVEILREIPEKIEKVHFEFEEIEKIVKRKMQEEGINKEIQKILLSLQRVDDKNFLVGTVFISMLGMLKVGIDLDKKEVVEFEKKSFFDIMKVKKKK